MKHNTRRWRGLCCNINSLNDPFKYSVSKIGESIMMNLLKKLAACGLSLTMILSLAACGGTDDTSSGESGGEPSSI